MKKNDWFGLEGYRDGLPILWRVRRLDQNTIKSEAKPQLFVLTWMYDSDDRSLLPSDSYYARLKRFEDEAIEEAESDQGALFVGTETGRGKSHYFFYVKSVQGFASFLESHIAADERIEFSSKADPNWEEYQRLV